MAGRPESLVQRLGVGGNVGERMKALCGGEFEQLEEFRGSLALSNLRDGGFVGSRELWAIRLKSVRQVPE